jgi:hypothetical protein
VAILQIKVNSNVIFVPKNASHVKDYQIMIAYHVVVSYFFMKIHAYRNVLRGFMLILARKSVKNAIQAALCALVLKISHVQSVKTNIIYIKVNVLRIARKDFGLIFTLKHAPNVILRALHVPDL